MEKCRKLSLKSRKTLSINNSSIKKSGARHVKHIADSFEPEVIAIDDEEAGKSATFTQQRDTVPVLDDKRKLQESNDANLNKLRDLIVRVSSNHRVNGSPLKPFPAYEVESFDNSPIQKGRLLSSTCFSVNKDGLAPFPSLPDRFLQRKRERKGGDKNMAKKEADTAKEENDSNTRRMPDKLTIASSISAVPVENCHLMRDRNSNFYTLQTRNHKQGHNGIDSINVNKPSTSTSNYSAKSTTSLDNSSSSANSQKTSNICSSTSSFQSAIKSNSAQKGLKSSTSKENIENCNTKEGSESSSCQKGLTSSSALKGLKRSHAQISNSKTSAKSLPADSAPNSASGNKNNGKFMKLDNAENSGFNNEPRIRRPKENVPTPSTSDLSRLESNLINSSVSIPERRVPDMLKTCPLCQTEFSKNSTQMDIDSHIAQCLSNSEDDVMW